MILHKYILPFNRYCISTSHADDTNHIDFNKTAITPNPVVFNESITQVRRFFKDLNIFHSFSYLNLELV